MICECGAEYMLHWVEQGGYYATDWVACVNGHVDTVQVGGHYGHDPCRCCFTRPADPRFGRAWDYNTDEGGYCSAECRKNDRVLRVARLALDLFEFVGPEDTEFRQEVVRQLIRELVEL